MSKNLRTSFLTARKASPPRAQPLSFDPRMFIGSKILITPAMIGRKSTHVQQSVTGRRVSPRLVTYYSSFPPSCHIPASVPRFIVSQRREDLAGIRLQRRRVYSLKYFYLLFFDRVTFKILWIINDKFRINKYFRY